jgi:hypothetical protein
MANDLELYVKGNFDVAVLFTEKNTLKKTLKDIETEVLSVVPDISTTKGRKEIASLAHKVSKSKVALDEAGKNLVSDWKIKAAKVDESRKHARDFLDNLKDKVRQPLTEWELAEETRIKAEIEAAKHSSDWDDAHKEHDLYLRMKDLERKEAELAAIKLQAELKAKAEREAEEARKQHKINEAERIAREKRIAEEAAARAIKEAEQKLIDAEIKRISDLAKAKANAEAKAKIEADKQERLKIAAENKRIAEIKAIKDAQDRKDREAKAALAKEKAETDKRTADMEHRRKINKEAVDFLVNILFDLKDAELVVDTISKGLVPNIFIKY